MHWDKNLFFNKKKKKKKKGGGIHYFQNKVK